MGVSVRGTEPPEPSASSSSLHFSLLAHSLDIIALPKSCPPKHYLQYWPGSPPTKLQCAACEEQVIAANSACDQHLNQAVKDIALPSAFTGGAITQTALSHPLSLFVILALPLCLLAQRVCLLIYRSRNNEKQLPSVYGPPLIKLSGQAGVLLWWKCMMCLQTGRSEEWSSPLKQTFNMWRLQLGASCIPTHVWKNTSSPLKSQLLQQQYDSVTTGQHVPGCSCIFTGRLKIVHPAKTS